MNLVSPVPLRTCPMCGTEVDFRLRKCPSCGEGVGDDPSTILSYRNAAAIYHSQRISLASAWLILGVFQCFFSVVLMNQSFHEHFVLRGVAISPKGILEIVLPFSLQTFIGLSGLLMVLGAILIVVHHPSGPRIGFYGNAMAALICLIPPGWCFLVIYLIVLGQALRLCDAVRLLTRSGYELGNLPEFTLLKPVPPGRPVK